LSDDDRQVRREFVLKMQQVTGPIAAKGMEDTAFYRFYPLLSLNEVGGDPAQPPAAPEQFHRRIGDRAGQFPHDMSATGTHDTKRGEDVRARLNVLSETPDAWAAAVSHWRDLNAALHKAEDDAVIPDSNEEYLIYQTMVGTWPVQSLDDEGWKSYTERLVQYFEKALHEAKLHTSWLSPDQDYDQAVANFVRSLMAGRESDFIKDLDRFARSIADAGFVNSLAQTLLKICVPGVPDFYQGSEFWDFALVDPDNRRPVDFQRRRETLAALRAASEQDHAKLVRELLTRWPDERVKMFVIWRALQLRNEYGDLFAGQYQPLGVVGNGDAKLLAFARTAGSEWLACIVPRLGLPAWQNETESVAKAPWPRGGWWRNSQVQLPAGAPRKWRHALTNQTVTSQESGGVTVFDAGALFEQFPVALLISDMEKS
jgi:(1->4)-alpha-D-glucan 1-alpha-D-glucosylmutase